MAGFAAKTMIYRGLGSGIVRAMREDNHIDFDVSANQFKVTIWRTTQNNKSSTQKNLDSSEEVLKFLIENPKATIGEMVDAISNLSLGGVKFVIGKLQKKGLLKRVGGESTESGKYSYNM